MTAQESKNLGALARRLENAKAARGVWAAIECLHRATLNRNASETYRDECAQILARLREPALAVMGAIEAERETRIAEAEDLLEAAQEWEET